MKLQVFNPGDTPVVYTDEGHSLGGGDWVETTKTDLVQELLDSEALIESPPKAKTKSSASSEAPATKTSTDEK